MALRFMKEIQGTRNSDHYATPISFYKKLNEEFMFDFDACPLRSVDDFLLKNWIGNIYINPPYSNIEPFINKGLKEINNGNANICVFLIPVRSDTKYWHEKILPNAAEIRFVKSRLNFNESKSPAPFPCCLVVFNNLKTNLKILSYGK